MYGIYVCMCQCSPQEYNIIRGMMEGVVSVWPVACDHVKTFFNRPIIYIHSHNCTATEGLFLYRWLYNTLKR